VPLSQKPVLTQAPQILRDSSQPSFTFFPYFFPDIIIPVIKRREKAFSWNDLVIKNPVELLGEMITQFPQSHMNMKLFKGF
jgi:hypothetical protein